MNQNQPPQPPGQYVDYEVVNNNPQQPYQQPYQQPHVAPQPQYQQPVQPQYQQVPIAENPEQVQQIAHQQASTEIARFDQFTSTNQMMELAKVLVAGKMVPFKTPEQAVTAILMAHDLGIGAGIAMNNVYNIEGKASISSHLVGYLIQRAGIIMETLVNYQNIYDGMGNLVDIEHVIRFHKFEPRLNKWITYDQRLTWSQVVQAGWADRPMWKKIPMVMMPYRCRILGARIFDPACLLGFLDVTEAADAAGKNYNMSEDGANFEIIK